ncbi:MAG: universal stress protein [Rhodospirillales bacterium]|jgi:nucleotide-binding universal stress UspA family protein|nr:universal stress protein [Rhodospirillales bacterium]MDP6774981.1 universal stress protein [Rhodospirillales bacterium]
MSIKTILVPVDGTEAARAALELAFVAGKQFSAHVDVLHVSGDPKDAVPLLGEGMSGAMIEEMIEYAEKEAAERATSGRRMFDEQCARDSVSVVETPPETPTAADTVSAAWVEVVGRDNEAVAQRGRLADLIVAGRPTADADPSATMVVNAALFETGRPVLVAPPGVSAAPAPAAMGSKVAIAWNLNAEAARAVTAAIPFLGRAESVVVVTAESKRTSSGAAGELVPYLAWHGISAVTKTIPPSRRAVGEALLGACADVGADMLVMGAYTHGRVRQLILGGVTRHVLAEATIPVLMAH